MDLLPVQNGRRRSKIGHITIDYARRRRFHDSDWFRRTASSLRLLAFSEATVRRSSRVGDEARQDLRAVLSH